MESQQAVDLVQQALIQAVWLAAPMLVAGLLIGLVVGVVQSITQVQDHTLGFVPKLVVVLVVICVCLPWLVDRMSDYGQQTIRDIPQVISGNETAVNESQP